MEGFMRSSSYFKTIVHILILVLHLCWIITYGGAGFVHAEPSEFNMTSFFSSDYQEARKKFLEASHAVNAQIKSFANPNTGPKGETLYTDIASIGTWN
jgi:hypothetical protein